MNKFRKCVAAVLLSAAMLSAVSCGGNGESDDMLGTYESVDLAFKESVTFKSGGRITLTALKTDMSGTYTIGDGNITYSVDVLGTENTETHKFSRDGDSIFIDDVEYKKK